MFFAKKTSLRRNLVRKNINTDRFSQISHLANADVLISSLIWLFFVFINSVLMSFPAGNIATETQRDTTVGFYHYGIWASVVVILLSIGGAVYIHHYQRRVLKNHTRAIALCVIFILFTGLAKAGYLLTGQLSWATGSAIAIAIILSIAYDLRFAIGMSVFYSLFVCLAVYPITNINLFFTILAGVCCCCFSLREIRTRMKLLEVSVIATVVVFITSLSTEFLSGTKSTGQIFSLSGYHAAATFIVGLLIQSLLPFIEKSFNIVTSMTLLDYSDANQPLLKRLAMEAPGTFSHSLLVGSIAEAAAEAIGRNGLLCRVGAYYHDIGKINKPSYFVENEVGSQSRHKELSPAMSQLIIVGHVKDGIEMAREYGLPAVLRQFIETHHGTTLVEYFYNEAKKQQDQNPKTKTAEKVLESEFRYSGPRPKTKEAAIVMLSDAVEGAVRSLDDVTVTKIEAVVHNMAIKRLQDGQFDECDISLRELSQIENSLTKSLAAHYHGRIAYPTKPDEPLRDTYKSENDKGQ